MRILRGQEGLTLIEVLIAAATMLIVLAATMTVFESSSRQQRLVDEHVDAQQTARVSLDRLAGDLRNLASPSDLSGAAVSSGSGILPRSVERNLPYDVIFQRVADTMPAGSFNRTNVQRVRYCLDSTDPERGRLWQQMQTWTSATPPGMPADTACPGTGWDAGKDATVASAVVNRAGGQARPVFRYATTSAAVTAGDDDSRADISRLRADLYIDPTPGRNPVESHLATALFLRNQNREPTARFTITPLNPLTRLMDLNATSSEDPEGQLLDYEFFYDPPTPLPSPLECKDVPEGGTRHPSCISTAARLQFTAPTWGEHTYVVRVTDPSGLTGVAEQKLTFTEPTS